MVGLLQPEPIENGVVPENYNTQDVDALFQQQSFLMFPVTNPRQRQTDHPFPNHRRKKRERERAPILSYCPCFSLPFFPPRPSAPFALRQYQRTQPAPYNSRTPLGLVTFSLLLRAIYSLFVVPHA